jgi:hypothetical protein
MLATSLITGSLDFDNVQKSVNLFKQNLLFDGSNQVFIKMNNLNLDVDFSKEVTLEQNMISRTQTGEPFHTDYVRLRKGGLGGQLFSFFSSCTDPNGIEKILQQLSLINDAAQKIPNEFKIITKSSELKDNFKYKIFSSLIGIEGNIKILIYRRTYN